MRRIATIAVLASAVALAVGATAAPALAAPAGHGQDVPRRLPPLAPLLTYQRGAL